MTATMAASRTSPAGRAAPAWLSGSIELAARPEAVPAARRWTRQLLSAWGLPELADDAESVVAELITNAVEATRRARLDTPVHLTLIAGLRTLLITTWDAAAAPPAPGNTGPDSEDGRGLIIVQALSASWDWKKAPRGGKVVRALIRGQRRP